MMLFFLRSLIVAKGKFSNKCKRGVWLVVGLSVVRKSVSGGFSNQNNPWDIMGIFRLMIGFLQEDLLKF